VNLKEKVLTGLKWNAVAKFSSQLLSWASTIFVIRLLAPEDYGLIAIATIFTSLCTVLSEMGLGAAIVQAEEMDDHKLRQVFSLVVYSNCLVFILLWFVAPFVAQFFAQPLVVDILRVQAIQYLIIMFYIVPHSCLTRRMAYKKLSIIEFVSFVINTAVTLTLALFGYGVWSLVIGVLMQILSKTVLINIINPFLSWLTFDFKGFRSTAAYGFYTSLDFILWYFYSKSDRFIIGKLLNADILGVYSVAMQLASLPLDKVGAIINQVALPAYARIQDDRDKVARYTLKAHNMVCMVAFPVFAGISCTAPVFIPLLLGEKWLDAVLPLQVIALLGPFRVLNNIMMRALAGIGLPRVNVENLSIACVIMPISFLIGVQWGITGVSISWIVGYSIWYLIMLHRVLPKLKIRADQFVANLLGPLTGTSLMYLFVIIIQYFFRLISMQLLAQLCALVFVGAALYSSVIVLFFRGRLDRAVEILRTKVDPENETVG